MRTNHLKKLLQEGRPALGLWSASGSTAVLEAAGHLDFDWILIDAEHGIGSTADLLGHLQALAGSTATSLVRIPAPDPVVVKRVLDHGAEGILVPQIQSAEQTAGLVSSCRYPPTGTRGIGPHRASGYFTDIGDYFARANQEIAVIVQIETLGAIEHLDAILAVEGLDGVLIGPADLSAALGHFGDAGHEDVRAVVDRVLDRARSAGVPAGYYCNSAREAKTRIEQGFQLVNVAHDLGSLMQGLRRSLESARGD